MAKKENRRESQLPSVENYNNCEGRRVGRQRRRKRVGVLGIQGSREEEQEGRLPSQPPGQVRRRVSTLSILCSSLTGVIMGPSRLSRRCGLHWLDGARQWSGTAVAQCVDATHLLQSASGWSGRCFVPIVISPACNPGRTVRWSATNTQWQGCGCNTVNHASPSPVAPRPDGTVRRAGWH